MVLLQKYFCNLKRQELTKIINLYIEIIKESYFYFDWYFVYQCKTGARINLHSRHCTKADTIRYAPYLGKEGHETKRIKNEKFGIFIRRNY